METRGTMEQHVTRILKSGGKMTIAQIINAWGRKPSYRSEVSGTVTRMADSGRLNREWDEQGEVRYTLA